MRSLKSLLQPLIREHRLEPGLLLLRLQSSWAELVGSPIAAHSFPLMVRGETLIVVVDSSVWSQELSLLREDLLRRVNCKGESPFLRHVRFHVGTLPEIPAPKVRRDASAAVGAAERAWIEGVVDPIADSDLKDQLRKALQRALGTPTSPRVP